MTSFMEFMSFPDDAGLTMPLDGQSTAEMLADADGVKQGHPLTPGAAADSDGRRASAQRCLLSLTKKDLPLLSSQIRSRPILAFPIHISVLSYSTDTASFFMSCRPTVPLYSETPWHLMAAILTCSLLSLSCLHLLRQMAALSSRVIPAFHPAQ